MDACSGLLIFFMVVALLAAFGHGLWVLAAAVLRAVFGESAPAEDHETRLPYCVGCGQALHSYQFQCPGCRLMFNSPLARDLHQLFQVFRQLRDLEDRGILSEALVNQIQDDFQARKAELLRTLKPGAVAEPEPALMAVPWEAEEAAEQVAVAEAIEMPPAIPELPPVPMVQPVLIEATCPEPAVEVLEAVPVEPPPRRQPFTQLLTAFMEERNILWGEVVGGLLIVGCSVALVISLWQTLQQIPYFPFIIIATVTAALFGAGLYTLERWKLQSTSRGLLMIASLLVPLDLLVMAGLHRDLGGRFDWLEVGVLAAFLSLFLFLLQKAGRVLLPEQSWLYPAGVLGTSAFELAVPMLGTPPGVGTAMLLGTASSACHGLTASRAIRHAARTPALDEGHAQRLFGFLGVSTFALGAVLGLLIYASEAAPAMLQGLAPLVALGGVPLLAGGALVHRRLADAPASAAMRTTGTGIALVGAAIQLAAIPLAWLEPANVHLFLGLVCLLNFVVLTASADRYRLPIAHVAALPALALGYLTVWHYLLHGPTDLVGWLATASAGAALAPLVAGLALVGEWWLRRDRQADGVCYAIGSGLLALASLALVSGTGMNNPLLAGWTYLLYAAGIVVCNVRWQRPALGYVGMALVPAGTMWLLQGFVSDQHLLWPAVLASEALILSVVGAMARQPCWRWPGRDVAAACGALAAVIAILQPWSPGLTWATATCALLAGTLLALAWSYRQAALTWLGSVLVLLALLNAFAGERLTPMALLAAFLGQATVTWLIARCVQRFAAAESDEIVRQPLDRSTLLSTFLALPLLAMPRQHQMLPFMGCAAWLSGLCLVQALERRWAWLFAMFQGALCVTVFFGVTAWLVEQPWLAASYPAGLIDPRSLQAYGIGLAGLSLLWAIARPVLRNRQWIQDLLEPAWPALDRVVLAELIILQMIMAIWGVLPAVAGELGLSHWTTYWPAVAHQAFGPGAWILVGLLTLVLAVRLWDQIATLPLAALITLAVTAALLAGGAAAPIQSARIALAWSLAGCFLAGSIFVWLREPLARWAARLRIPVDGAPLWPCLWLLIGGCIAPVIALSLLRLVAPSSARPLPGTFFAELGPGLRLGVPLLVISLTLVGHALRERSAGFAFAGGLVALLALVGGVALYLLRTRQVIDVAGSVFMLQLATVAAAAWAIAWLASRRWVQVWTEEKPGDLLMTWQNGMAVAGNLVLLLGAAIGVAAWRPGLEVSAWSEAAGSPWGWLALVLTAVALAWRGRQIERELELPVIAGFSLLLIALIAASVAGLAEPQWSFRALMQGAAFFALAWSLRAVPLPFADDGEQEAAYCVGIGYALAVLLGLKAAFVHDDQLWAAGAIGLSACVGALMAVWQRREGWALAAGLGLNLATLLVVWHQHRGAPLGDWWYTLFQANCIASGLVALIWLAARERFLGMGHVAPRQYLAGQIALGLIGNLPVLGLAYLILFFDPDPSFLIRGQLGNIGQLGGWLALLIPLAAAFWHAAQVQPGRRLPLLVWHGLGGGVLAGCFLMPWDTGDWLAFHALTGCWLAVATAIAILPALRPDDGALAFTDEEIEHWARMAGSLVVLLALRGSLGDPAGMLWSFAAVLGVAAVAVWLGVWSRRPGYTYASGLLIVLAGNLLWVEYGQSARSVEAFVSVNVLCLGLASALGSIIDIATQRKARPAAVPFGVLARPVALLLLGGLISLTLSADLLGERPLQTGTLAWTALMAAAVAQLLYWWQCRHGTERDDFAAFGLYAVGLLAIGLTLHDMGLRTDELAWSIGLALAIYVLAVTLIDRFFGEEIQPPWFLVAQLLAGLTATSLGLWISVHFSGFASRLGGPLALLLLVDAAVLLSRRRVASNFFRHAALLLAGLILIALGWSVLGQPPLLPWLHRNVVLMAALIVAGAVLAGGRPTLPLEWQASAWRMARCLTAAAGIALLVVIAQEVVSYNRDLEPRRTELEIWAIVMGALSCLALMVFANGAALAGDRSSTGSWLNGRWRTVYVYLAELVLLCLFLHMRLTAPWLFQKWLAPYWMFLIMAVAFAGVGLSELFRRRGLNVLAEPLVNTGLFLPLLPLLAFWVNEPAALAKPWALHFLPGTEPLLDYLERSARHWDKYSGVWFLSAALFGMVALSRRSFGFALAAALATNFGLWSFWQHAEISFLVHPQFFLIPLGLIVLVTEHVNRDRLPAAQAQALRYAALGILYLASTADMYIAGLDQVGWPLLLMLLCVLGVLAGMLFEVRAYVFLGTGFLFLVIFSMIWHAAVDKHQPWVWWASGIGLGVAILALFAVFEKRRNDVLLMVERIKAWN